jgi:Xaa-Pro dipeptidase
MSYAPAPELAADERAALVATRLQALRELLGRHNATAIKLDARRDFAWLTCGGQNHILYTTETGVAPIVVSVDDAAVLAPVNEFDRIAAEEVSGLPLRVASLPWSDPGAADREVKRIAGRDGLVITAADVADELTQLRSVLARPELARMEWLATVVRSVVDEVVGEVRKQSSEDDIVAGTLGLFSARAVRVPVVLVASDDRIDRYRHPLPFSRRIERRVMLVVVAERWGLHVALTQFAELDRRSQQLDERALALSDVLAAMRAATAPANTLGDVFTAAQRAYAAAGMPDEWELHHQGGTIGYQARERIATPGDATVIVPGMAFAWNPSAPGYKLEETLYLDEDGAARVLTSTTTT